MLNRSIRKKKSLELISAAEQGNLEKVKTLVADPEVDINYLKQEPSPDDHHANQSNIFHTSPLSIAVQKGHSDVTIYLLRMGALSDAPAGIFFIEKGYFSSVLNITNYYKKTNIETFKLLLRKTNNIFCDIHGYPIIDRLKYLETETSNQRASMYLHELVLRNIPEMIDKCVEVIEAKKEQSSNAHHYVDIHFSASTFKEYIADINLTSAQLLQAKNGLQYLVSKNMITQSECDQMTDMLKKVPVMPQEIEPLQKEIAVLRHRNAVLEEQSKMLEGLLKKIETVESASESRSIFKARV